MTAAKKSVAIERSGSAVIQGTFHSPEAVNARLAAASEQYHLVSPFQGAGVLPDGCGVAITLVSVDVENETYPLQGKRGLSKPVLDRIAHALGLSWDPHLSRRLDSGRDPYYCHFLAVGQYRAVDGQVQSIQGHKEMDLRPGSPQVEALEARARAKGKSSADDQVRELRLFILAHAETKARLRAIRSLGLRTAYDSHELSKPFACARLVFTGRSSDPESQRMYRQMTAASFLGGTAALYGNAPAREPAALLAPADAPPIGSVAIDDDDDFIETTAVAEATSTVTARAPETPTAERREPTPQTNADSGEVIRFGKAKGTPVRAADDRTIEWHLKAAREAVNDPAKSRFKADNERYLAALQAESDRRNGVVSDESEMDDSDNWVAGRE